MSILTYNGITLPYPFITKFDQTPLRDESDTDWYGTRFDIEVQILLTESFFDKMGQRYAGYGFTNPADMLGLIRKDLLEHRKELSFIYNGSEIIPSRLKGNQGYVDIKNGPKPQKCNIIEMTDSTFLLHFHIIAHYWESNENLEYVEGEGFVNKKGNIVLYNRWTETVELDNCNYSTRTRAGRYIIRSDNAEGKTADEVREQMAVISVPPGFLRQSASYTISPDGLGIDYRVTDKECYKPPPFPAFEAKGSYTEVVSKANAVRHGYVSLWLKGPKNVPQDDLVKTALAMAIMKLVRNTALGVNYIRDSKDPTKLIGITSLGMLTQCSLNVDMFDNVVSVQIGSMMSQTPSRLANIAGLNDIFEKAGIKSEQSQICITPLTTVYGEIPEYKSRGTANLLLRAACYNDPDLQSKLSSADTQNFNFEETVTNTDNKVQMSRGKEVGKEGKQGT